MNGRRIRVLIVDDEPAVRRLLTRSLHERCEVMTAADGKEALAMARAHKPDIILLDIVMPGMDGYGVCRELQADPFISDIPVLMVSSLSAHEQVCRGLDIGADDYLTKPFDIAELRGRMRRLLTERKNFIHSAAKHLGREADYGAAHHRRTDPPESRGAC